MYLAPLNYDRYFKKVFSDERIVKRFLEDFLEKPITMIERLPEKHQVTDDASIVEFDYRCQIEDTFVIVDMQQWYKPDLVQRFYLYHALNTGLQLETLPKERFVLNHKTQQSRKVRDYAALAPVLTMIWMVEDSLRFKENYVAYTMTPELVTDFIHNERLWQNPELTELLKERQHVLQVCDNPSKRLDFLAKNRLIFMFQLNIVKHPKAKKYERWFRFAEKCRNHDNTAEDFAEFGDDEIFEEMMRRLNKSTLKDDDYEYIENEDEMWAEVERLERGYFNEGLQQGLKQGLQQGRAEGEAKGEAKAKRNLARQMLSEGLPLAMVAKITGLSEAEIFNKELVCPEEEKL